MEADRAKRSRVHAALSDASRLAIVDELSLSDRAPSELAARLGLAGNLLAHHLDVLEQVGLIVRFESSGDRRRRYVRLDRQPLHALGLPIASAPSSVLFVCTHNSARSQLASALWKERIGTPASSAGTHPADRVHPDAVAAGARLGLDLSHAAPSLIAGPLHTVQVVTVCDRAYEELDPDPSWWHWSLPDPVEADDPRAFDAVLADLDSRISTHIT
ncbi:arsenate reductase/protein-tyrosine-phosphatase family protein [Ilumatobacter nonamiensis]|uniref:arsenate reductase/protein-tyrosine-phosphatase family protein n=1 Tax=Ilumatobacter nonamiensis TaxID=467093 RepID=UPI00058F524E|nr:helix-turn-helix domain-containing protein [Ilumatobacter nonamiensis]